MKRTAVAMELNQPTGAEQSAWLQTVPVPVCSISFRHVCQGVGIMPDVPAAHLSVSPDTLATSTRHLQGHVAIMTTHFKVTGTYEGFCILHHHWQAM